MHSNTWGATDCIAFKKLKYHFLHQPRRGPLPPLLFTVGQRKQHLMGWSQDSPSGQGIKLKYNCRSNTKCWTAFIQFNCTLLPHQLLDKWVDRSFLIDAKCYVTIMLPMKTGGKKSRKKEHWVPRYVIMQEYHKPDSSANPTPHKTHSDTCTNMSSAPVSGVMKPWPWERENCLHTPL